MIKFDGTNSLFLPNFSRNSVSTFSIKGITKDDFKIKTKVKIDWDNLDMKQRACGIVVLNGMDMGIFCGMYKKQKMIMAQIWTQGNEKADMEQVWVDINDDRDTFDIEIDYQYQSGLTLKVDKDSKTLMFKNNIVDYSESFLWVGCCNNNLYVPENLKGNLVGEMYSLQLYSKKDCVADYDFKLMTDYKVYDYSGNANHLLKKFLNEEGQLIIF
tara:strand:- start:217 stop:858 length:642 start_codon:yes stop_codon:yes gene_type:complete